MFFVDSPQLLLLHSITSKLPNIAYLNNPSSEGLLRYAISISRCLASFLGSFLIIKISSTALAVCLALLPAPTVVRALANILE